MIEETNEQELNRTYALGQSAGLKQAADHVMKKATIIFEQIGTKEGKAEDIRAIASELYKQADDQRPPSPDEK